MLFCYTLLCSSLRPACLYRVGGRQGATQGTKSWTGWIHILPLICSEKCPAQRTLTPINPATGCYRCSGRHQCCMCMCVGGLGGVAGFGTSALRAGFRHRLNLSAHYPPRPDWGADKCTLGPQAKLIHLPSFSSGSEVAAARRQGEGAIRWWETETGERGERVEDGVRWRRETSSERGVPGFVPHPCLISLFLLLSLLALSLYSTTNTSLSWNHYQDMHLLPHQVPSWKLAQGQASGFTTGRVNGFLLLFWRVPVYPLRLLIIHYS